MNDLSDADIDRIARDYVSRRYDTRLLPLRKFHLRDPDGVFFGLADPHSQRPESAAGAFGDAGFFIYRRDGTIRQFDPGDFVPGSRNPPGDAIDQRLVAAVAAAIRHFP
jgi:hypothetical protein